MKKIIFLCLLTGAFLFSHAVNTVVIKPFVEGYGLRTWSIDSVRLSDTATVVYGRINLGKGYSISVSMDSYLEIPTTGKSYKQIGLKGLPIAPEMVEGTGQTFNYEFIFPSIDPSTKVINIVSKDNEMKGNDVVWYGVWLTPRTTIFTEALSNIPGLEGNWYNDGTWKAGFYAKKIYWNKEFWNFNVLTCKDNNASIELSKPKTQKVMLQLKKETDSSLMLTGNGKTEWFTKRQVYNQPDSSMFNTKFSKNDSITVIGYYQVVHPNYAKKAALLVSDLAVTPLIYPIKIAEDGTFKIKIPLLHTTLVTFSNQLGNLSTLSSVNFIAEPGNEIVLSYRNENEKAVVFSGDNERFNNEFQAFSNANPYFITERVLRDRMTKEWAVNVMWRKEKLEQLKLGYANWVKTHPVNVKFNEYMQYNMKYAPVSELLKLYLAGNRTVDFDGLPVSTEIAFYNNPAAIILPEYMNMLNLFKPLQLSGLRSFSFGRIVTYLKETVSPTVNEISLLNKFDSVQTSLKSKMDMGKLQRFQKENGAQLDSIFKKYQMEITNYIRIATEKSKQRYQLPEGFAKDVSVAFDLMATLSKEESTLTVQQIDELKKNCKIPDLVDVIILRNEALKIKLEKIVTDKLPKEVKTYTLPEDTKDLTTSILKKYKAKVVYVDFWATWCAPCKAEMPFSEKQKEYFKGKDVVFVYITGATSPELIWKKMIATIPGEHYKLSEKQWKEICDKYAITSIPHYLIFNKKGEMVDVAAPRPSTDSVLQNAIEKLLK